MPGVDYVIGNLNPRKWELLSEIAGSPVMSEYPDFALPAGILRTRPYIKIQEGCDARCSYCIIPSVRGRSRSLPLEEVVRRVEHFRDQGYREMIFTGISMGAYGKDLTPRTSLTELMRQIDRMRGNFKIRLSSVEPEEINGDFVEAFLASNRFQPHLHLPLQSASNRVLKKMRRQYLFPHFDRIVSRLFAGNPNLNLGTDILVGFPSEDREAFEETCRYVQEGPFSYCHVFPFSPRPETPAAGYARCATDSEISSRAARLRELAKQKNYSYRMRFEGKQLPAIRLQGTTEALTANYIRVQLDSDEQDVEYIRINKVDKDHTFGSAVAH
jgi:threonylcarbamoyladenosine tRNA methylthiotransferase MtaB